MAIFTALEHAELDRVAYPTSPQTRFVQDGTSEGALLTQMFLDDQIKSGKLAGKPIAEDGQNGKATRELVAAYQVAHHIQPTGYVNDTTFAAMQKDGFQLDGPNGYLKKSQAYLASPQGRQYNDRNKEAIYQHEMAYMTGSEKKDAAITFTNPPRQGFAVASIQYQMNEDYKRVYGDHPPTGYAPLPITGQFDEATQARLLQWQKDDSLHGPTSDTDKTPVHLLQPNGQFDRKTYDAFYWNPASDGQRTGDDYGKNGLDSARFARDLRDPNSELAAHLGKATVDRLNNLEALEQARRSQSLMPGHVKLSIQPDVFNPAASPVVIKQGSRTP